MHAQVTASSIVSSWRIPQILEAAKLCSGISDEDLIEIGNAASDSPDLMLEIDRFLQDFTELDRMSRAMMLDATGQQPESLNPHQVEGDLHVLRPQLYSLTQRLIFSLGGRAPDTLKNIAEVFEATATQDAKGVGLREFRGFLASVLTQLRKERTPDCRADNNLPEPATAAPNDTWSGSSESGSWLQGIAARLLHTVDYIDALAIRLDDLVESHQANPPDELATATTGTAMHFRTPLEAR